MIKGLLKLDILKLIKDWFAESKNDWFAESKNVFNSQVEDKFISLMISDLCSWLAENTEVAKEAWSAELKKLFHGEKVEMLEPYKFEFECELVHLPDGDCDRILHLLGVFGQGEVTQGEMTRKVNWEDLPRNIRNEFTKTGNERIIYKLFANSDK